MTAKSDAPRESTTSTSFHASIPGARMVLSTRRIGQPNHGAAMESNHPSGGLPRPAGFEDRMGHQTPAAPRPRLSQGGRSPAPAVRARYGNFPQRGKASRGRNPSLRLLLTASSSGLGSVLFV